MRLTPIFAAILAFTGLASATPAAAAALTKPAPISAATTANPTTGTTADQYRDRRGWRGDRGWRGNRGWRGDRGWRRGYYRRGYAYRPYRSWNRGRVVCRYRHGYRRCFRTY